MTIAVLRSMSNSTTSVGEAVNLPLNRIDHKPRGDGHQQLRGSAQRFGMMNGARPKT